jgi:hypothetical protein
MLIFAFCQLAILPSAPVLAADGDYLWAGALGGSSFGEGFAITVDAAGNVYSTGNFQDTADFDPGAGTFELTSFGGEDIFVSKLDSSGNFVWARSIGGTFSDEGNGLVVDASGNIYITGYFANTVDFDPGPDTNNLVSDPSGNIFVLKLDSSGSLVWAKAMGGPISDEGLAIAIDRSGNVYTTGYFYGTADFDPDATGTFELTAVLEDIFVSKLDSSGNFAWAGAMSGDLVERGNAIAVDWSGNVHITGQFTGTVDFDPGSGSFALTSAGNFDIFVCKLDNSGNFAWAGAMGGGIGQDFGHGIGVDAKGNVYTTGFFSDTADFDPGPDPFELTSSGSSDIFISKLDRNGSLVWAKSMGGTNSDYGYGLAVDAKGNVCTAGHFQGAVDFDPGEGTANLNSGVFVNIFISKLAGPDRFPWIIYYPAILD